MTLLGKWGQPNRGDGRRRKPVIRTRTNQMRVRVRLIRARIRVRTGKSLSAILYVLSGFFAQQQLLGGKVATL